MNMYEDSLGSKPLKFKHMNEITNDNEDTFKSEEGDFTQRDDWNLY